MKDHRQLKPDSEALAKRLHILKETLPECFSEGRLDPDKLRETLGEDSLDEGPERYGLNWPGKREARARAFKPSNMALHLAPGEGVNEKETKNLIIEGENLEVLRLLQKAYRGRVKMIYIDPPYNTGNDFVYDDKFAENPLEYEKRSGLRAEDGSALQSNRKSSGRYHSNWLSMMYPRLVLARELLREDGVIFISIDENEKNNLGLLITEVFGEENNRATVYWQKRYTRSNNTIDFTTMIEPIFAVAKSSFFEVNLLERSSEADARYSNPDNDPRGPWKGASFLNPATPSQRPRLCYSITNPNTKQTTKPTTNAWRRSEEEFHKLLSDNRLYWGKDGKSPVPSIKMFLSEARKLTPVDFWDHKYAGNTDDGTRDLSSLFSRKVFDNPKPIQLIKRVLEHSSSSDSIILDFFAGSGTTAQAVLELNEEDGGNRQFILVQMPEETPPDSEARKAGYDTIADIAKERVRRVIKKIGKEKGRLTDRDRGFRVYKLAKTGFRRWQDYAGKSLEEYEKQLFLHLAEADEKAKEDDLVAEIMLREGFPLDSKMERMEEGSLVVNRVESEASAHRLFICMDAGIGRSLTVRTFQKLGVAPEDVFVCRDEAVSDEAKLRIRELCRLATV